MTQTEKEFFKTFDKEYKAFKDSGVLPKLRGCNTENISTEEEKREAMNVDLEKFKKISEESAIWWGKHFGPNAIN